MVCVYVKRIQIFEFHIIYRVYLFKENTRISILITRVKLLYPILNEN